jgi:ABC-type multidrug transport system ATPase subunit
MDGYDHNRNDNTSDIDVKGTNTVVITVNDAEHVISKILQLVYKNDMQIESISINPPSLEEVFLSIVNNKDDDNSWAR